MGILGIIIIAIAISFKYKKDIGETVPVAILGSSIVMYLLGRYTNLNIAFVGILLVIALSLVYCLYKLFRRDEELSYITSWGGRALLFYILFFGLYSISRDFSHPDELYCWGLMAKGYYYSNDLFSEMNTALTADHPPLLPIWNYFSTKTWICFSDSMCYFATDIMTIALVLPVFSRVKDKLNSVKFLILLLTLPLFALVSGLETYFISLPDGIIAMLLCFAVVSIMNYNERRESFYFVSIIISLCALVLIKRVGILFAAFAIVIAMPAFWGKSGIKSLLKRTAICAIVTALVELSWVGVSKNVLISLLMALMGLSVLLGASFLRNISQAIRKILLWTVILGTILGLNLGAVYYSSRDAYITVVLAKFMGEFLRISFEDGYCNVSYGFFVAILGLFILHIRRSSENEALCKLLGMTLLSMIVFILLMLYVHIIEVGPSNNFKETLIARYYIPWECLVVFIIYAYFVINSNRMTIKKMCVAYFLVALISGSGMFYRCLFSRHHSMEYNAFEDAGIELKSEDYIYYIDENYIFNWADREFYYKSYPARTNLISDTLNGTLDETDVTSEELAARFDEVGYDYVYLQSYFDDFVERCGSLFESDGDIAPGCVYQIVKDGDSYKLVLLSAK